MWFIEDLARFDHEQQVVAGLDREVPWLNEVSWYIDQGIAWIECVIQVEENNFPIRVEYPVRYPDMPAAVKPREPAHWSDHQWGDGGDLCLELGPDNWHPDQHDTRDLLESAERLLRLERAQTLDPSTKIPSREESTPGQDARALGLRLILTDESLRFLDGLVPTDRVRGTVCLSFRGEPISGLARLATATRGDDSNSIAWTDSTIPSIILGQNAYKRLVAILPGEQSADAWQALRTAEGFNQARTTLDIEETSGIHILVRSETDPWTLFCPISGDNDRPPIRYTGIHVSSEDTSARIGLGDLDEKQVAIVGLGSMGSRLALSLARSGVRRFVLVDDDLVEPNNLVRHDADWDMVGLHKVDQVSARLHAINPNMEVIQRRHRVGGQESASSAGSMIRLVAEADLIIDATAVPNVFNILSQTARRAKTAMVWMETLGGGIGGVIARARPDEDPDPFTVRAALNAYCEAHPHT